MIQKKEVIMKRKVIFLFIIILIIFILIQIYIHLYRNTNSYIENINYDMEVHFYYFNPPEGGYATTEEYVLVNTKSKTAHYINRYHVIFPELEGKKPDKYTVKKFKLNDYQINTLIEASVRESENVKNTYNFLKYIEIKYNNKSTTLVNPLSQEIIDFLDRG